MVYIDAGLLLCCEDGKEERHVRQGMKKDKIEASQSSKDGMRSRHSIGLEWRRHAI